MLKWNIKKQSKTLFLTKADAVRKTITVFNIFFFLQNLSSVLPNWGQLNCPSCCHMPSVATSHVMSPLENSIHIRD